MVPSCRTPFDHFLSKIAGDRRSELTNLNLRRQYPRSASDRTDLSRGCPCGPAPQPLDDGRVTARETIFQRSLRPTVRIPSDVKRR